MLRGCILLALMYLNLLSQDLQTIEYTITITFLLSMLDSRYAYTTHPMQSSLSKRAQNSASSTVLLCKSLACSKIPFSDKNPLRETLPRFEENQGWRLMNEIKILQYLKR